MSGVEIAKILRDISKLQGIIFNVIRPRRHDFITDEVTTEEKFYDMAKSVIILENYGDDVYINFDAPTVDKAYRLPDGSMLTTSRDAEKLYVRAVSTKAEVKISRLGWW